MVRFVSIRMMLTAACAFVASWTVLAEAYGQDCLEPCECHPLSDGLVISVEADGECAPLSVDLVSNLASDLWVDHAFEWEINGGEFEWTNGADEGSPDPTIVLQESGIYQFALIATDTAGVGCSATSNTVTFVVAGAPQVMISDAPDLCAWEEGVVEVLVNPGNTALTSFAWGAGGAWDTLAFPAPLVQVFETAGANEVIAAASNACGADLDTAYVQVFPTPALEVHSEYNWYCMGSYADFIASGDGEFVWNANSEVLSGGQPGDSTVRLAVGSQVVGSVFTTIDHGSVQCTSSAGFTAYGFFVPSVTIGADEVACVGDEVELDANIFSFGWDTSVEWILNGAAVDTVHAPTASQSTTSSFGWEGETTPGVYEFQAAVTFDPYPAWLPDYGCADTTSHVVAVTALPEVSSVPIWEVCNQSFSEPLPEANPIGGEWQGPNGPVQLAVDPLDYGLGQHEFTYAFTDANGCQSTDTTLLVVEEPIQAMAGLDSTFCESNAIVTVPSSQSGGWWSGPGVLFPESGVVDLAQLVVGQNSLMYMLGEGSCATSDEVIWEVMESPMAFLSSEGSLFCDGDTVWLDVLAGGGTLAEGSAYNFNWTEQVVFTSTGVPYYVADVNEPLETIGLIVTDDEGCADEAVTFVNAMPLPEVVIPALGVECDSDFSVELPQPSASMGTWSGQGIAHPDGVFNPAVAGIGITELTFTATSILGCENSDMALIEVIAAPTVDAGNGISVCAGAPAVALEGFSPLDGWWEGPLTASNDSVIFDPGTAVAGNYEAIYHIGEGSCHVSDALEIEVLSLPVLQPVLEETICEGDTALVHVDVVNADDFSGYSVMWSGANLITELDAWSVASGPWAAGDAPEASVTVTTESGCSASAVASWSVNALPEITLPEGWSVCANVDMALLPDASPSGGAWTGAGVEGESFMPAEALGNSELEYSIEDANGCTNSAILAAEIVLPIEIDLGPKLHECEGIGAVWLPTPEALSGNWAGPGLLDAASGEVDLNELLPGAYVYAFTHAGEVCTSTADAEMEVHPKPTVQVASEPVACVDSLMTMSATTDAGTEPFAFAWNIGGQTWETEVPSYTTAWSQSGVEDVALETTDAWGCATTISWTTEIQSPVSVAMTAAMAICNQAIPVDLMQSVQPAVEGASQFYGLNLASAAVSTAGLVNPEMLPTGEHEIVYLFQPNEGCVFQDTLTLEVGVAADITAGSDLSVCFDYGVVELPAENGTLPVWWAAETEQTIAAIVDANSGTVDVSLLPVGVHTFSISTGEGTCAASDTLDLEVLELPQVDLPALDAACANGAPVMLPDPWPNGGAWQGTGVTDMAFNPELSGVGEFVLTYEFVDVSTACANDMTVGITVHDAVDLSLTPSALEGCSPFDVSVMVEDWDGSEITWSVGDSVFTEASALASLILQAPGMYEITAEAVDANGCERQASHTLEVIPAPEVDWALEINEWCGVPAVIPVGLDAGAAEVQWHVNGSLVAIGQTAELEFEEAGWYALEAVVTNEFGCVKSLADSLEALPLPSATLNADPMLGCSPLEVTLDFEHDAEEAHLMLSSAAAEWLLSTSDSVLVLDEAGGYQLALHVVDARGCENTIELADSIQVLQSPIVDFEPSPYAGTWDNPDPLNSSWSFENLSDDGQALWDFGDGGMSTNWNGSHTYEAPGTYEVHVMVVNEFGCSGEAAMEVEVEENLQVFVPNAFTPPTNGYSDGVNDGWRPEISAPELVDRYWLRVFNRYGQLVWESHDPEEYWIGQAGQQSDHFGMNDAYTWVLRVDSRAQRPAQREWRGHVTLIR